MQGTALADPSEQVQIEVAKGAQASVISLVEALIASAHSLGASDLHLDPCSSEVVVRLRIDGILSNAHTLPSRLHPELISRIKVLSNLRTDEHQAAQDGRFTFNASTGERIDVRVSIVPTYYGENAVLRLLAPLTDTSNLAELGFSPTHRELIHAALRKPQGMILVTGPTGSGKTSTLYALITLLNTGGIKIVTIEDPIEYAIENVSQIQVNARTALTFAHGLRSMLRQDPNVIMVGEVRDAETAGLAVNIALTGHLVLSTLHTSDAPGALPRLLDLKVEPYLIASTVSMVIAERLARRICTNCKEERLLTEIEQASIRAILPSAPAITKGFRGTGCMECGGSGYKGRIGIFEVLLVDEAIREAVLRKAPVRELSALARAQGMKPLIEDGLEKLASGETTLEEVLRICHEY